MNLSGARSDCADAIRAKFPEQDADGQFIVRVVEIDSISEDELPILADGIFAATDATVPAMRGPAAIAVMARGRQGSQAIELTAYTIVRTRLAIELPDTGRSRGLATLDLVEEAMRELPAQHGLPVLLVESTSILLERQTTEMYEDAVHVYATRCVWPPAHPEAPLAVEAGSSTGAIRDHVAAAITIDLPAATAAQAGKDEADRRAALVAGMVPRAWVTLHTERETIGGAPDFLVRDSVQWEDSESPPRRWTARAVEQTVVVDVHVAHRTKNLADEAALRIAGRLEDSAVIWPGNFDARVLENSNMVTRRLTGGTYAQHVRLVMFERAEWDDTQGLGVALLRLAIEAVDPIAPATQRVSLGGLEHDAHLVVPVGTVKVEEGDDLTVGEETHGLAGTITATSDDLDVAWVAVNGSVVTISGVNRGEAAVLIAEDESGAQRRLQVRVQRG